MYALYRPDILRTILHVLLSLGAMIIDIASSNRSGNKVHLRAMETTICTQLGPRARDGTPRVLQEDHAVCFDLEGDVTPGGPAGRGGVTGAVFANEIRPRLWFDVFPILVDFAQLFRARQVHHRASNLGVRDG